MDPSDTTKVGEIGRALVSGGVSSGVQPAHIDEKRAGDNLAVAELPVIYERALKAGYAPEKAEEMLRQHVPEGAEAVVLRHQNVTAVVVNEPGKGKISVTYDATEEFRDKVDNAKFWGHDSPIGGTVHTGYFDAIARKNEKGQSVIAHVNEQVAQFASKEGGDVDVTLTGFSRGGSLSVATAAQWMKGGMPGGDKVHLAEVQTFGSPPYGDKEFVQNFMKKSEAWHTDVSRVVAGDDTVPSAMTGGGLFNPALYTQAGNVSYLMSYKTGEKETLTNPSAEVLDAKKENLPELKWHNPAIYAALLNRSDLEIGEIAPVKTPDAGPKSAHRHR